MEEIINQRDKVENLENLLENAKRLRQEYTYFYGTLYDTAKENLPGEGHYDIVVYVGSKISRAKESIEGTFVSSQELSGSEKFVRRDQMQDFEKKYNGTFVPNKQLNSADAGGN